MQIKSSIHDYYVEEFDRFGDAAAAAATAANPIFLIDRRVHELYPQEFAAIPLERSVLIEASEKQNPSRA
jgi:hypothetical protein